MIISGGARSNWRFFAKHLMKAEENERVHVAEIKGLAADTVLEAFREMDALASCTRTTNFFYHADINPREDEHLTEEQWEQAIDTLERNLGLEGHSRFVVEHEKNGRIHRHVVWSRIDPDTLTAVSAFQDYRDHQKTSRELEQAFGLEPVNGVLGPDGKRVTRRPKNWEVLRGSHSGIDPQAVKAEITDLWQRSDTGQAFAAALEERGYILAKGDRRDFVVVDQAGDEHSLARRVAGAKAADIRSRMAGIDRESLPTVQAARELARGRRAEHDREDEVKQPDPAPPPADPAKARDTSRTLQAVAEEVLHTAKDAIAGKERVAPSPADIPKPSPAPQAAPPMEPQPSAFERFARKVTEAAQAFGGGPTAAESMDPARQPAAPPSGPPGHPAPGAFERVAEELLRDAKEAAPIVGELAAEGAALEAEPSAFERAVEARNRALRNAGGTGLFITEGLVWLAGKLGPKSDPLPVDRALTPFERRVQDTNQALRDNGGEPYSPDGTSFWERTVARMMEASDRARTWVKEVAKGFTERLLGEERNDSNNHQRER